MDLEARSLPPTQKANLLTKLREYKSDLTNLKRDVKKSSSADAAAARDDLLESGMGDHINVCLHNLFSSRSFTLSFSCYPSYCTFPCPFFDLMFSS